jgi:hypothetical protein
MMKGILGLSLVLMVAAFAGAQNKDAPVFVGSESSFENYFYKSFLTMQKTTENTCDTSLGLIEFHIDKDGRVKSVLIPSNFPEEVARIIDATIMNSTWAAVKGKKMRRKLSIPVVLPLYISIETGCKPGNIKGKFGLDRDFRMMFPDINGAPILNRFVMKPIAYVVPAGFQDLNPKN